MILTLDETKKFLKVDFIDDDAYIQLLIDGSSEYLKNATDVTFDSTNSLAKLFCLAIVSDLYDNRQFTVDKTSEKVRYTLQSILMQLGYSYSVV